MAGPTLEVGAKPLNMRRLASPNAIGGYATIAEEEKGPQRKLRAVPRWFLRDRRGEVWSAGGELTSAVG